MIHTTRWGKKTLPIGCAPLDSVVVVFFLRFFIMLKKSFAVRHKHALSHTHTHEHTLFTWITSKCTVSSTTTTTNLIEKQSKRLTDWLYLARVQANGLASTGKYVAGSIPSYAGDKSLFVKSHAYWKTCWHSEPAAVSFHLNNYYFVFIISIFCCQ